MTPHGHYKISSLFPLLGYWSNLAACCGAASCAAGIVCADLIPLQLPVSYAQLYLLLRVAAIICTVLGVLITRNRFRVVAFFLCGVMFMWAQKTGSELVDSAINGIAGEVRITGKLISPPQPRGRGFSFLFSIIEIDGARHEWLSGRTFLCISGEYPSLEAGSLAVDGRICRARPKSGQYGFDEKKFLTAEGIAGKIDVERIVDAKPPAGLSGKAKAAFRKRLAALYKKYPDPDHRALIRASFTGERGCIAPEINSMFKRSGLIHLLALSGFNAAIVLGAVYLLLFQLPVPPMCRHLVALVVLWVYCGFVGNIPSLTRAIIMASMVVLALMKEYDNHPMQALGLAALAGMIISPGQIFQPGFQLSYGATFGILTVHPFFMKVCKFPRSVPPFVMDKLLVPLSVSVAAFIATAPILVYHFGVLSIYGIIANIVAIPLMSFSMWSFFVALAASPFAGWVVTGAVSVSGVLLDGLLAVAAFADRLPWSLITVPFPYLEITVAFYVVMVAAVTADRSHLRIYLGWSVPFLLCMSAIDVMAHRVSAATLVHCFGAEGKASVTVVRWPRGESLAFCSGSGRSVDFLLNGAVAEWARRTEGTIVKRFFIAKQDGGMVDSAAGEKARRIRGDTMVRIVNPSPCCTCTFAPCDSRGKFVVKYGAGFLVHDHATTRVDLSEPSADSIARLTSVVTPAQFVMGRHGFFVRRSK